MTSWSAIRFTRSSRAWAALLRSLAISFGMLVSVFANGGRGSLLALSLTCAISSESSTGPGPERDGTGAFGTKTSLDNWTMVSKSLCRNRSGCLWRADIRVP